MALKVWLPLNGNLNNQGLSNLTFSNTNTTNLTVDTAGKIGACYKRGTKQTTGYITSDQKYNFDGDITILCWAYVSDCMNPGGLVTLHNHSTNTNVGINAVNESSTDYRITCNTGNGSSRTYSSYRGITNIKDKWCHLGLTYDKAAKQLLLYVDGNIEYTLNNYTNASQADWIRLFEWSVNYDSTSYRPAAKLNDVRIYDECLSQKQIKEISKGLVAHYKLDNPYIETATNLAPGLNATTSYSINNSPSWDTTLNGAPMITPSGWSTGYNGGVTDPTHGYHAHWIKEKGQWEMIFPNLNSIINQKGRWLGISGTVSTKDILPGEKYTIQWWQKTDNLSLAAWGGIYFKKTSDGSYNFWDGCPTFGYNTKLNTWEFMSRTFTRVSDYTQNDTNQSIYVYGGNSNEGTMYVKDVQIVRGEHSLPYTVGTRAGQNYESDCSGNGYTAKVTGALTFNPGSARYSGSTYFNGSSYLTSANNAMSWFPFDNFTISIWINPTVKPSTWTGTVGIQNDGYKTGKIFNISNYAGNFSVTYTDGSIWGIIQSNELPLNTWSHITATLENGTTVKMYLNGVLVKTTTIDYQTLGTTSDTRIAIGVDLPGDDEKYTGYYSDARIYATVLSADDILTTYKNSGIIDNKGNVYAYEFKEE